MRKHVNIASGLRNLSPRTIENLAVCFPCFDAEFAVEVADKWLKRTINVQFVSNFWLRVFNTGLQTFNQGQKRSIIPGERTGFVGLGCIE
jgi:hypothetical protein